MHEYVEKRGLRIFATVFIHLFLITYVPIEGSSGFGIIKAVLSVSAAVVLLFHTFKLSKALLIGVVYLLYQYLSASFHPDTWRWSTLIFSAMLVCNYICIYNLIVIEKVFSIDHFIKICKWVMMAYFVVCIMQQFAIIIGIRHLPIINFMTYLDRGIGCNSLSQEPSTFGRYMLVFYYAYVKCEEYRRGEGAFTLQELFQGRHRWVTVRFLWMMLTMGSGTAFVCLILFSLYFVRRQNWYYVIPLLIISYGLIHASGIEALDRATNAIEATSTLDAQTVRETDGSASARIVPMLNSLNADFTSFETWFGKGIDAGHRISSANRTLFNDYGVVLYIIALLFSFTCAYDFWSLGTIFMFAGVGGGCGHNIYYAWGLMMVMTCVKYFHANRENLELESETAEEER